MSCKEYAETQHIGWGEFKERESFHLYLHPGSRLKVVHESHTRSGFGYERREALEQQGISDAQVDSEEFANEFIEKFCEHLSRRQVSTLIAALTKYSAEQFTPKEDKA